jgi:hypothetical protein
VTWSPAARERVCQLWLSREMPASAIASVIAEEYGVVASKSAIIGIAYRSGLAEQGWKRPSGTSPAARARKNAAQAATRAAARAALPPKPPKPPAAPKPLARPRPAIAAASPSGLPQSLGIPLTAIRDGQCKFIADDPAGGGATCCGHATASGSPWCPAHRALCVTGTVAKPSVFIPFARMRRAA